MPRDPCVSAQHSFTLSPSFAFTALCLLFFVGCEQPRSGPDGPLIDPIDGLAGVVELLAVADGKIAHEDVEFLEFLQSTEKTVIVDFWATWCGPCRMLTPELENVALARSKDVVVLKVNVDEQQELSAHFQVSSIPDMRLFKNGVAVDTWVGFHSADDMISRLK